MAPGRLKSLLQRSAPPLLPSHPSRRRRSQPGSHRHLPPLRPCATPAAPRQSVRRRPSAPARWMMQGSTNFPVLPLPRSPPRPLHLLSAKRAERRKIDVSPTPREPPFWGEENSRTGWQNLRGMLMGFCFSCQHCGAGAEESSGATPPAASPA